MATETFGERLVGVVAMLVLGVGFLDLFMDVLPGVPFFLVWIIGFAVVVPIVALLLGVDDEEEEGFVRGFEREMERFGEQMERTFEGGDRRERSEHRTNDRETDEESTADAIETLRTRYARGDLTDEQFESKLDRLMETDTPENAAAWRERERDRERGREPDAER
ncbi:SHOCT domain-containing protein [Halomarina rubra]|uniref:SHOCT domain-containing protein n=1 Tax=Halomarina rubra TaxID=2071873 RepID=A0ABD6ATV7_9EURY|nr:SHOCT domain-containing protein [Halomarina rubra]